MSLSKLYTDHLRQHRPANAAALAEGLRATQPFEAGLLAHHAKHGVSELTAQDGPWKGRRVFIGPRLPPALEPGQLWFDTREVAAMVLVPREPPAADWAEEAIARWTPFIAWLSLRPVATWQYRAFFELAQVKSARIESNAFTPYDPVRICGRDEHAPVARLTAQEAHTFARWMGKDLPSQGAWQAARSLLPGAIDVLWGRLEKEWIGYPDDSADEALAICPQIIDGDLGDEHDAEEAWPPENQMIYRFHDHSASFGFRTAVFAEVGLYANESIGLGKR